MTRLQEDFILNEAKHVIKRGQAITFERIVMLRLRPRFLNDRRLFHRFQQFFLSSFHFPFPQFDQLPSNFIQRQKNSINQYHGIRRLNFQFDYPLVITSLQTGYFH